LERVDKVVCRRVVSIWLLPLFSVQWQSGDVYTATQHSGRTEG